MVRAREAAQRDLDRRLPGSRYGKSRAVGVTATLFATVGVLPYIALQPQAVSSTFRAIAEPTPWTTAAPAWSTADTSLIVAAPDGGLHHPVRRAQRAASEQHRGMMLAMAFKSVVKLVALLDGRPVRACSCCSTAGRPVARLVDRAGRARAGGARGLAAQLVVTTLLSAMAFLCLPRQFHAAVVEHGHPASLATPLAVPDLPAC